MRSAIVVLINPYSLMALLWPYGIMAPCLFSLELAEWFLFMVAYLRFLMFELSYPNASWFNGFYFCGSGSQRVLIVKIIVLLTLNLR